MNEGHYRLLKRVKALGDYLIAGVTTEHYDEPREKLNVEDSMMVRLIFAYVQVFQLIGSLGLKSKVLVLGWRDDISYLMQAMDVFVLPFWLEGWPVTLIETQAASLKCLTSEFVIEEAVITKNSTGLPLDKRTKKLQKEYEREDKNMEKLYMDKTKIITGGGYLVCKMFSLNAYGNVA